MISGDRAGPGRTVEVVIGCDSDPDRETLVGPLPPDRLAWRGITEGIPALKASVADLRDAGGRAPVFTWLIRADEQVRALLGDYAGAFGAHAALHRDLALGGDELGWHPHFWRLDPVAHTWYQEVEDTAWQLEMLRGAHAALSAALAEPIESVRMGWNYHNGQTIRALDALGVVVDFSSLPGLRTYHGAPPPRSENLFDWHNAPRLPYFPSVADHQRRARGGEARLRLLELPIFVASAPGWGVVSGLQLARKTRSMAPLGDALRRPTFWVNLTAKPRLFAPLITALVRELRHESAEPLVFATYFHPDELIPNRSRLYDLPSVRANLSAILAACDRAGAIVEFRQAAEVARRLVAGPSSAVA
ncbi:MAG: hypothetical protein WD771_03870 [Gemmatimonadaceae bacterium]